MIKALKQLGSSCHRPYFWGASGYPIVGGPGDVAGWVSILRQPQWENHDVLASMNQSKFISAQSKFRSILTYQRDDDSLPENVKLEQQRIIEDLRSFTQHAIIRRTTSTQWPSPDISPPRPIVKLLPHTHLKTTFCRTN